MEKNKKKTCETYGTQWKETILALHEFWKEKRKRKGQRVHLKQQWLKTSWTWGENTHPDPWDPNWHIQNTERKGLSIKHTTPSEAILRLWKRNTDFLEQTKLREFKTTRPALQEMLKGIL